MNDTLQFASPIWLWLGLISCSALTYGMVIWNRRREKDLAKLAHTRLLSQLTETFSRRRRWFKQGLWLLAFFMVFAALARPQYGNEYREVKRRGIDLVFAVDTSRSMLAEDAVPNRLERARIAITDFVDRLEGDRIGLIPFAGKAFSLCPLTLDYSAFKQSLDVLTTEIIPHQGTDLASAVEEADRLFEEEGNSHRILILITDGEDLQGEVSEAVATAKKKGMTIHTIGVGEPGGSPIPISQQGGFQDFIRDDNGEIVKSALDEATLKKIAAETGGIYAPLGAGGQGLNFIYQEKLRLVPKTEMDQRLDRVPLERFEWPLAIAITLLILEYLLDEHRRARAKESVFVRGPRRLWDRWRVARTSLFLLAVFQTGASAGQVNPQITYNEGTIAYQAGEFEKAEQILSKGLGETTDLQLQQKSYYNLGNTRFRLGQASLQSKPEETIKRWEASVKAYEDALVLNEKDQDAEFNRDLVKKKLEELKKQQEQKDQQDPKKDEQQKDEQQKDQQQKDQQQKDQQQKDQQQKDQQQKDQQQKDQQQKDQQQKDQQQKDQQQKDQQQKDQQQKDQQQKDQQQKDQQQKDQQQKDQQQKDQQQKGQEEEKGQEQKEQADKPGEKGEKGEPSEPKESGEEKEMGDQGISEERRKPGEMSREEAAQLLESLLSDERNVTPLPDARTYRQKVPNNTTRGKTW